MDKSAAAADRYRGNSHGTAAEGRNPYGKYVEERRIVFRTFAYLHLRKSYVIGNFIIENPARKFITGLVREAEPSISPRYTSVVEVPLFRN